MSHTIPDEDYTFQDAFVEAKELSIPAKMTGMGLRLELSSTHSVRCGTALAAREVLREAREERIKEEVSRIDAAFAWLEKIEASYRKYFGPIPPITER